MSAPDNPRYTYHRQTFWDRIAPAIWVVAVASLFLGGGFALAFWWLSEMFRGALP